MIRKEYDDKRRIFEEDLRLLHLMVRKEEE